MTSCINLEQIEMFPRSFVDMENVQVIRGPGDTILGHVVFGARGEPGKYYVHAHWNGYDAPPCTRKVGWESLLKIER